MKPEELRQRLYREPFEPFRVRVKDGRSFDIRHPSWNLVGESVFIIGVPAPEELNPKFADHTVWVPLSLIDGLDPLPSRLDSVRRDADNTFNPAQGGAVMKPEELRQRLYREPFQPFRVRVKDGRSFDIRYPDLNLVGESIFIIGIPAPGDPNPKFYDRQVWLPLELIAGIDPLSESSAPAAS